MTREDRELHSDVRKFIDAHRAPVLFALDDISAWTIFRDACLNVELVVQQKGPLTPEAKIYVESLLRLMAVLYRREKNETVYRIVLHYPKSMYFEYDILLSMKGGKGTIKYHHKQILPDSKKSGPA